MLGIKRLILRKKSVKKHLFLYIALLWLLTSSLFAQILDDSTKQVYNATTTRFIKEGDLKEHTTDTTIQNFHHYTVREKSLHKWVDLGVFCTATRPLFYQTPARIGTRLGIDPYLPYTFTPEQMRYFDTKSPFSQIKYVQGTSGDQSIQVLFTRSWKKRWNFAIHYVRENANKQYGTVTSRDPLADLIRFAAPIRYESKKKKYIALFHYTNLNHQSYETGGATVAVNDTENTIFSPRFATTILKSTPRGWQTQNTLYLYQQYRVDSAFTVFVRAKAYWQRDTYTERDTANYAFYPLKNHATNVGNFYLFDAGAEGTWYSLYEQESGMKGKWKGFGYEAFFRSRYFTYRTSRDGDSLNSVVNNALKRETIISFPATRKTEIFLGGKLTYQTKKGYGVTLFAEYQPAGDYHLQGELKAKNFRLAGKSMLYAPSLLQQRFLSNFIIWNNSFKRTLANDLEGELLFAGKGWHIKPALRYVLLSQYIYLDNISPRQAEGIVQLVQPSFSFAGQARRIRINSETYYTLRTGVDVLRQPALSGFGQLYCEDCFLKKQLQTQIGIDWHYKTAYFADAYMPVSKQFYWQNTAQIPAYIATDIFLNFRLKQLRGFLKLGYASQLPNKGYLLAPDYPTMRRQFTFGLDWMFFD